MPQPIDFQTETARLTQVERIQQIADRASLVAQQRLTVEADTARLRAEEDVQETHETGQEALDADGRRKNPFAGRRRRKADEQHGSTPEPRPQPDGAHHLDVSI